MRSKNTKIVCTIGPASSDEKTLIQMIKHGMNLVRLNFSHGTHDEKREVIQKIRRLSQKLKTPLGIIADLQGPKLRLGAFDGVQQIAQGETVHLSITPKKGEIPLQFDLSQYVKINQRVFLNDGLIELKVLDVKGKVITAIAKNSGQISAHKGVNIPDTHLPNMALSDKDYEDAGFALQQKVDYLALSFVQHQSDVTELRKLIIHLHPKTKIIVKIEKKEALENLSSIIKASDAVMVARGDLGIEVSASMVPIIQQKIITIARQYHRPVIVATQMLESMITNPRPTRAETSDVANAVLSQVDAVMLSAESASGKYPVEAVSTMHEIICSIEENPDFHHYIKINWEQIPTDELSFNAIASTAAGLAHHVSSPIIAVATATGRTARLMSAFRPNAHIVAVAHDQEICNQLNLLWGVSPIVVKPTKLSDKFWQNIAKEIVKQRFARKHERIVMVGGSIIGVSGATDTIKIVRL